MAKKSLIVSILGYLIFFSFIFAVSPKEDDFEYEVSLFFYSLILTAVPIIAITFILVWLLNLQLKKQIINKAKKEKNRSYFISGFVLALIPIIVFAIFDFSQSNQFGFKNSFFYNLSKYFAFLILALFVIILNRKIVWKNFK
jgi:hypothetical protein